MSLRLNECLLYFISWYLTQYRACVGAQPEMEIMYWKSWEEGAVQCVGCVSECEIWGHWRTGEKSDVMLSILPFGRVPGVNCPRSHTQTSPRRELAGAQQAQVSHSLLLASPSEQFLIPTSDTCGRTSRGSKVTKSHSSDTGFHLNSFENCSVKHHQKLFYKKNLEWNKSSEGRVNGMTNGWDTMSLRRSRMRQNWGNTGF